MLDYSRNEVANRAKLAARGAGYSWGMAEEVANSVFWLGGRNAPAPQMLAILLSSYTENDSVAHYAPRMVDHNAHGSTDWLCPVASGCALTDNYLDLATDTTINLANVRCPVLMIPFVAELARRCKQALYLESNDDCICTDGQFLRVQSGSLLTADHEASLRVRIASEPMSPKMRALEHSDRVMITDSDWASLASYAARTYAPATAASRASGAGAGLTDND